jgi:hypothetical protein
MLKHTFGALAFTAALAAPAFAQQQPPQPNAASSTIGQGATGGGFAQNQSADDLRGSKLIGASVHGPDNSSIGEISDLLIAPDGKIQAVVVGVGGFLGLAQKDVALPFQSLTIRRSPVSSAIDKITVSYSKDQLNNTPAFTFVGAPAAQTTGGSTAATPPMKPQQ